MTDELRLILMTLATIGVAFVVCFGATPLVRMFAQTVGAVDVPDAGRHMHKKPVTRLGGLAIYMGFIVAVILFADVTTQVQGILLGSVVIVVLGVVDDIMRLGALVKFVVQIAAALIPVFHGVVIEYISNPNIFSDTPYVALGVLAIPATVIWIVIITNSVNLIDGLDGLAVGVSSIASVSLLVIAITLPEPNTAVIMAALVGACLGFLPYNRNPARMFMGDTGATFLGYILAAVSIQGLFKFYAIVSFAVPFLILGLPIFDTAFAITRRLLRGESPMKADRSHVHHKLMDMGFSQKQSVAILYAISAVLGVAAVVLTSSGEVKAMLLILAVIAAILIGTNVKFTPLRSKADQEKTNAGQTEGAAPCGDDAEKPGETDGE